MADDREMLVRAVRDAHGADLTRYVLRHTADREFAEDLVQEVLTRAWKHPAALEREPGAVRAWLFTVARNLLIDDARSARRAHEIVTDEPPERSRPDGVDAVLDRMLIEDALASLSADHRAVVVDAYYLGRSIRQSAEHLDLAEGTVKSRLHYGLRALRLALQERGVSR